MHQYKRLPGSSVESRLLLAMSVAVFGDPMPVATEEERKTTLDALSRAGFTTVCISLVAAASHADSMIDDQLLEASQIYEKVGGYIHRLQDSSMTVLDSLDLVSAVRSKLASNAVVVDDAIRNLYMLIRLSLRSDIATTVLDHMSRSL